MDTAAFRRAAVCGRPVRSWVRALESVAADVPVAGPAPTLRDGSEAPAGGSGPSLGLWRRPLHRRAQLDCDGLYLPGQHASVAWMGRRRTAVALPRSVSSAGQCARMARIAPTPARVRFRARRRVDVVRVVAG